MRKTFFIALLILSTHAFAQKSKFIGDYLLGKSRGDTMTAKLLLSVDTFKLIYVVEHDSDDVFPVYMGTWSVDDNHNVVLNSFEGRIFSGNFYLQHLREDLSIIRLKIDNNIYTRSPGRDQMKLK